MFGQHKNLYFFIESRHNITINNIRIFVVSSSTLLYIRISAVGTAHIQANVTVTTQVSLLSNGEQTADARQSLQQYGQ
jgi:hypothetical protein